MQIAVRMAGYSMGQADTLRKVMAKKKRELVGQERERFVAGCVEQGISERLAADLFDLIEPFADYGFPAAHACAYGFIAYQTAYLMAHHPVEYMAAILTSVKDDKDRKPYYLYACRSMGIDVLPPDVNESDMDFAPAPGERRAIRYGLSAVRNVGEGVVRPILDARRSGGPVRSRSPISAVGSTRALDEAGPRVARSTPARSTPSATRAAGWCSRAASRRRGRRSPRRSSPSARPRPPGSSRSSAGATAGLGEIDEAVLAETRARQAAAPVQGEGDARPVRHRPPAARGRGRAPGADDPRRSMSCPTSATATSSRVGGHHRVARPQVHEAGRALRAVPAGGARRRRRGGGVPERLRGRAGADGARHDRPGHRSDRPARPGAADPRERGEGASARSGRSEAPRRVARGRPAGHRVHARRPRRSSSTLRGAPGRPPGAAAVPLFGGRDPAARSVRSASTPAGSLMGELRVLLGRRVAAGLDRSG